MLKSKYYESLKGKAKDKKAAPTVWHSVTHRFFSLIFLGRHWFYQAVFPVYRFYRQIISFRKCFTCLHPAGLVWIASVIVGSPMLFVQQLEVSGVPS